MPNTCLYFAPNLGFIIGVIETAKKTLGIETASLPNQNNSMSAVKIEKREIRLILTGYEAYVDRGALYGREDALEKTVGNKLQAWELSDFKHYTKNENEMHLVFSVSSLPEK